MLKWSSRNAAFYQTKSSAVEMCSVWIYV